MNARWTPANYEEQEAAKVPRELGLDWLMCRSDASMHQYRREGPYWWLAVRYAPDFVTVHLFKDAASVRHKMKHQAYWRSGSYCGHGRVTFKS